MAITMDLTESHSDSRLLTDSTNKDELRPASDVSISKSEQNQCKFNLETSYSSEQLRQYKAWVTHERWNELKKIAEVAMKENKVFMIKGGGFHSVRRALIARGWVEKFETHRIRHPPPNSDPSKATGKELSRIERTILYKFMESHAVDFLWTTKRDRYDWLLAKKEVIISRFCRSIFTTKEGLTTSLTQMHWYTQPGISMTKFPRCYNIQNSESLEEFIDDFRITACISICKWLTKSIEEKGEAAIVCPQGKVPMSAIIFAMNRLKEFIAFCSHKDIDDGETEQNRVWDHEWDQFLTHHYLLIHEKAKIIEDKGYNIKLVEKAGAKILTQMTKYWPQLDIDGIMNIWIVKPGNKCRGRGIQLMNNIKDIISLLNVPAQKSRYVVQKYIENPLVIYNTKFDIRQWFLVTNCQPLTIWVYKESYLRFSSQIFSLFNYHESVHLTNNAVQSRYKNNGSRDKALPDENMWDCHSFKAYLKQIGQYEKWDEKIYPGIKECLIGAMLACQDSMDKRQNSFELYGADFMLTEDFTPWLIEINSSPDLGSTTSVTARMCPQCLTDVIKVVIDRRASPEADTGSFELAYRQVLPKAPAYLGLTLCVNGKKLYGKKIKENRKHEKVVIPVPPRQPSGDALPYFEDQPIPPEYSGPIITDFLTWLNPYDALPTNSDGIVLPAPRENSLPSSMVRHQVLNIAKSAIAFKNSASKKRKTSAFSFRSHRGKREKRSECKRRIVPHSCYRPQEDCDRFVRNKFGTDLSVKSERPKLIDRSVGNKRCYIDPVEWERETASILRTTISIQNKNVNRVENAPVPARQSKSSVVTSQQLNKSMLENYNTRSGFVDSDIEKITAIGRNITKLGSDNKAKKRENSKSPLSIYAPYRVIMTPLANESQHPMRKSSK